jgi:hypothetical protein
LRRTQPVGRSRRDELLERYPVVPRRSQNHCCRGQCAESRRQTRHVIVPILIIAFGGRVLVERSHISPRIVLVLGGPGSIVMMMRIDRYGRREMSHLMRFPRGGRARKEESR